MGPAAVAFFQDDAIDPNNADAAEGLASVVEDDAVVVVDPGFSPLFGIASATFSFTSENKDSAHFYQNKDNI
jgi:hypothetical protein